MNQIRDPQSQFDCLACLADGGEMGVLMRSLDWSKTPLGPVASWSPTLQTTVRTLLANRFPLLLWWGPQYIQIYNDAYRPIPGTKHPKSLGQAACECWPEIWHIIGPLIDTPFRGGPATWMEDILLQPNRHGFVEETHFTIAYSPVPDATAAGGIGGVLASAHEITAKVVSDRRMSALRDLGVRSTSEAKTAEEVCEIAAKTLAAYDKDVPFALIYLTDADGKRARLLCAAGAPKGQDISPQIVELDGGGASPWPLAEARRSKALQFVDNLARRFPSIPPGPWSDPPNAAAVLPIRSNIAHQTAGFLIAGISSRLRFDDAYRGFLELAAAQIATAITNARAYEEEKKRAEALAELDRAKTAFFSNVSHEFRTPLTLMLGPVEGLLATDRSDLSSAVAEQLKVVNRNGQRLLRLVNTLLEFSRIEAGRVQAVYQPTDLAVLTADLASVFRAAVERAGLRLTIDCQPLTAPVFVDREMWEKIVLNLLSNAFKFTFEGEIVVSLRQLTPARSVSEGTPLAYASGSDSAVELRVKDSGTGVRTEDIPRLFERFYRVENARGRTHEGSGIGLALVQELVKLHSGTVTADSVFGQGTTITVTLPLGPAHLPPERIGAGRTLASTATGAHPYVEEALRWLSDEQRGDEDRFEPADLHDLLPVPHLRPERQEINNRPHLLVADDNADMRQYIVRLLADHFHIEAVADGEAALAAARQRPPDLILTDVMMPRLDGFGLLRELRADPRIRSLPVILLTARAGEESRVEGMEAGADDYLVKPFSARELLARVTAHLQRAQLRREAEERLRRAEERWRTMAETLPNLVWTDLPDGQCDWLSSQWGKYTGIPENELLGLRWLEEVIHPDDRERTRACWKAACADQGDYDLEYRIRRYDGEYHWFKTRGAPIRDEHGKITYWFGSCTDIEDIKLLEAALREADRKKDEFLATLAHELRNPLAPLRNGLHLLKLARNDGNAIEQALPMMERQLMQMVRLIDDLLDVSRISQGKIELRKERIDLAKIVHQAIETSRPLIEANGLELTIHVPSEPIFVNADMTRMAQVFANLLNNAAKYTERGGRIALMVERQQGDVLVRVKDTGVGIPAHMLTKVFDTFTQVDRSLERSQGGLGIGLSLVQGVVEMHGGSVEAKSEGCGMGSEFVVRLPMLSSLDEEQRPDVDGGRAAATAPRRILVADDNHDAAISLAMMLKIMGNDTRAAFDGCEALDVATEFLPDVILLDIGMPKLNGYEAARSIREQPWGKNVVLVALTGWGQDDDRRRSLEAGFDFHVVKPIEPAALSQLLADVRWRTG